MIRNILLLFTIFSLWLATVCNSNKWLPGQFLYLVFWRSLFIYFFKDLIYLFLDRVEGKERERNINVWLPLMHPLLGLWPATQACALTGNQTGNPLIYRLPVNPLSHTSQGYFPISKYCTLLTSLLEFRIAILCYIRNALHHPLALNK